MTPRRSIRRSRISLLLAIVGLAAVAVGPAAAKEGFEARLDAPISIGSVPGSTLSLGWTVFTMVDDEKLPMFGSPVFIRLLPRGGGNPVTEFGTERPGGSGHYLADIVVPPSGVGMVEIGLRGEQCEAGVCWTSDMRFKVTGEILASPGTPGAVLGVLPPAPSVAAPAAAEVPAVAAAPDTTATAPAATTAPAWTVAVGAGLALIAAVAIAAVWWMRRRRHLTITASRS
jgi:hypothetical protein